MKMHMLKKLVTTQLLSQPGNKIVEKVGVRLRREESPTHVGPLLVAVLIFGVVILSTISITLGGLLQSIHFAVNTATSQPPITMLNVQRTAPYAGLNFTVLTAQYSTSFNDDTIQAGPAMVRLNIRVANKTAQQIPVIYYDVIRLLVPGAHPVVVAPTNILSYGIIPGSNGPACNVAPVSSGPLPGKSETDCVDFPVPKEVQLKTLSLQLGSVAAGEFLVIVPLSGAYDPGRYADRVSAQNVDIPYTYYDVNNNTHQFLYHLTSVSISYSYGGMQSKSGEQFYILSFRVDNLSGVNVTPGLGYDYVRLIIAGNAHTPVDSTLPDAFSTGASNVAGQVVFTGPAGARNITVGLLLQNGALMQKADVQL
jgi:hypothetical protein